MRLAAAGGDDFAVSARPVVNDLLTRYREGVVSVDVRLEAFGKESYAFIKHAARQLGRDSALVGACRVRGLPEADRHDTDAALQAFDEATPIAAPFPQPLEAARFAAAHGLVLARLGKRKAVADRTAEARSILQRIGAQPYLESADRQLARIGGRASGDRGRASSPRPNGRSHSSSLPGCPTGRPPNGSR